MKTAKPIGFIARRILARNPIGEVVAKFDRSAYLDVGGALVCLAAPELDPGPLTVPCGDIAGLRAGMRFAPVLDDLAIWHPPLSAGWTAASLERGLGAIAIHALSHAPAEGLGRFLFGGQPSNNVVATARGPVRLLSMWLEREIAGDSIPVPEEIDDLVGLGTGLTPSGDDFLGGAMVAAQGLGRADIAGKLFASLRLSNTNRISAAHLGTASQGAASAPLHAMLNDVLCGRADKLSFRVAGLNRMGHCSGWDAFAGCCLVLQAYCSEAAANQAA